MESLLSVRRPNCIILSYICRILACPANGLAAPYPGNPKVTPGMTQRIPRRVGWETQGQGGRGGGGQEIMFMPIPTRNACEVFLLQR